MRASQYAIGQQVLNAIEDLDCRLGIPSSRNGGLLYKTKTIRGRPGVSKLQTKIVIGLFKNELVTQHILVEVSCDAVDACVRAREWLPQHPLATLIGNDNRSTARIVRVISNFVLGVVREQRAIAIRTASREAAACRDKHPMIGIANDTDEEIIHAIDVGNTIKRFTITSDVVTLNDSGRSIKRIGTQIQRFVSHISQSLIS